MNEESAAHPPTLGSPVLRLVRRVARYALAVAVPAAQAAEVDLRASLHGSAAFPNATGLSEYERGNGGREVEVTVSRIAKLAGKRVTFFVAGQKIGTAVVSSLGRVHIERERTLLWYNNAGRHKDTK